MIIKDSRYIQHSVCIGDIGDLVIFFKIIIGKLSVDCLYLNVNCYK